MKAGIESLIEAADLLFKELRADKNNFSLDAQKEFQGVLYTLGYSLAKKCETQEEFETFFDKIALHPVDALWAPNSVLGGAENADNSKISIPKVDEKYFKLPRCAGALRLFTKPGQVFTIGNGTYNIIGHNPEDYCSPVQCRFVLGKREREGQDIYEFCGDSVGSAIDADRLKLYEKSLRR